VASLPPWLDQHTYSQFDNKYTHSDSRKINLQMPAAQAMHRKRVLEVLLIGHLLGPQVVDEDLRYHSPTLDVPYDVVTKQRNVHIMLEQFWIFDSSTGEVISRYSDAPLVVISQ
jgi:hypothetical protein